MAIFLARLAEMHFEKPLCKFLLTVFETDLITVGF